MKRTTALIGTIAAATLVVGGCGNASHLSKGASLTQADFARSLSTSAGQAKSVHMQGIITAAGQKVVMNADESMNGTSLDDLLMDLNMSLGTTGNISARFVHGVIYMNIASLGLPGTSGSKPWVKFDLNDTSNPLGQIFSKLSSSFGSQTFMKSFGAIATFKNVGSATVRGVDTTHYTVTVDTQKAESMLGLPSNMTGASGLPKMLAYQVYVDDQARPVEMSFKAPQTSMQMFFSKWGEQLHVVAPPASQVEDFSQLNLGGGLH